MKLQPATSVPATSADGCEHGAFRRFYEGTAASLRRYLARMLGSHETAQDVAQDAYVRVHAAMGRTAIERPQAYLYITARRLALDELRKRRADPLNMRYAEALEEVLAEGPGVEQIVMARQELAVLLQDIDTLPPGCRRVFLLGRMQNLTHAQIATQLGISVGTVEKHHMRALRLLREKRIQRAEKGKA